MSIFPRRRTGDKVTSSQVSPSRWRTNWRWMAFTGLIVAALATTSWMTRGPSSIAPRAVAQTTWPSPPPGYDAIQEIWRAATQAAATQPAMEMAALAQAQANWRVYGQLKGELSFMQDHLARMQAQGHSDADIQSIQGVISDLQTQVQTAAATTQPTSQPCCGG